MRSFRTQGVIAIAFFLAVTALGAPAALAAEQVVNVQKLFRVGFSSRVFPDVDQRDALVAMELWTRELARGMGIRVLPQTVIFNNTSDLLNAVKRGELTVVILPAMEYLLIRDKAPMTPSLVAANNAGKGRQYVLIVRRDSGIRSVSDLHDRSISLLSESRHEVSRIWLNVQLMKSGYWDRDTFFRRVRESASSSQAIMGVFFKQSDAALVRRSALEASLALNPQTGKQLMVIAESRNLHGDVTCIPNMVDGQLRRLIENTGLHLHERTVGKQMFTLFQIDQTIPFNPSYLDGIVDLLRERDRLQAQQTKRR